MDAFENEYLITAASFNEWNGLIAGHGYIVKGHLKIKGQDGQEIRLVKVRNPWKQIGDPLIKGSSHGDWVGKYSCNKTSTPEIVSQLNLKSLSKGEFYMSIDDFRSGFKYFTITYMHKDYQSSFLEKRDAVSRRLYKFNFTIYDEPPRVERHP